MHGPEPRTNAVRIAILLAALALLGFGAGGLWPWISDDAFISLRYAERFWNGDGLTWSDGERVEGYSNLLWVMLACGGQIVGLDWVATVRVLGIAASAATLVVVVQTRWLRRHGPAPCSAALILAASAPFALWAIGGLETPLALLLTTAGFAAVGSVLDARDERPGSRAALAAGICFALLCWTRPDGPLAGVLAAIAVAVFSRRSRARRFWCIAAPVALAVLLQLMFRLLYYGDWLPNTAHAKVGFSRAALVQGVDYLGSAAIILRALLVPAALGAVLGLLDRRWRPFAALVLMYAAAWTLYTAAVGGDLFPLCRILLPLLGPLTLLSALGFALLTTLRHGAAAVWALALLAALGARLDASLDADDPYQQISSWEWDGQPTGRWLQRAFGEQRPLLALDAAGGVPFFSRLPCLDMLGLNDRHIATAPLPRPDYFHPGHARGDGAYVLDREPDLVLFASPTGDPSPRWPGSWQMESDPRFLRDYRCVVCRTGPVEVVGRGIVDLKLTLWVRLAGRVGLQPDGDGFRLPGYLLGAHRQPMPFQRYEPGGPQAEGAELTRLLTAAAAMQQWWDGEQCVGVLAAGSKGPAAELRGGGSLVLERLPLPQGDFVAAPIPADAPLDLELRPVDGGFDLAARTRPGARLPVTIEAVRITPR